MLVVFFASRQPALSQDQRTPHRTQAWIALFNQTKLTERSGIWVDLHYRMNDDLLGVTSISRLGYTYFFKNQLGLTAGYGYVHHFSQNVTIPDIPEHRPWQQLQWTRTGQGHRLFQYIRAEERIRQKYSDTKLVDDYNFNWRFRYNIAWSIPLKGKSLGPKIPFLLLNDELHINAGKTTRGHRFDQNRLFLGVGYPFTRQVNASLGYLYVYQQVRPSSYVNISAIRLYVTANLDLRNPQ